MDVVEVRMATVGDSLRSMSCATPWPAKSAWASANRLPVLPMILSPFSDWHFAGSCLGYHFERFHDGRLVRFHDGRPVFWLEHF
jgi:hypothetical protein